MAFGRACLIGDAAFVPLPDTVAGTAKAVTDAAELAKSLSDRRGNDITAALEEVGAGPA